MPVLINESFTEIDIGYSVTINSCDEDECAERNGLAVGLLTTKTD